MNRSSKTAGFSNLLVASAALLCGIILALVGGKGFPFGVVLLILLVVGFLISVMGFFHVSLKSREQLEAMELEELQRSSRGASIFETSEVEGLPARRSREQFEQWAVPVFTTALFILECVVIYYAVRYLSGSFQTQSATVAAGQVTKFISMDLAYVLMGGGALLGLVLFLYGQYTTRFARMSGETLLQPAAEYLLLTGYFLFGLVLVVGVGFQFQMIHLYASWALVGFIGCIAFERFLALVLEGYRPRMRGEKLRLIYQSRLVGLFSKPESFFVTAAQTLDYQFGFKVSETWGYKFLQERIGVIVLGQVVLFWLSTSVTVIQPSEVGLVERFGQPLVTVLNPGASFTMPWPIDKVKRFTPDKVQSFYVGLPPDEDEHGHSEGEHGHGNGKAHFWAQAHRVKDYDELMKKGLLYFSVGSTNKEVESNLIYASIPVQFRVKDVRKWITSYTEPAKLLRTLATREVSRHFLKMDFDALMSQERVAAMDALLAKIQDSANRHGLGVEILMIGLGDIHPPAESPRPPAIVADGPPPSGPGAPPVAVTYEDLVNARQEKARDIRFATLRQKSNLLLTESTVAQINAEGAAKLREIRIGGRAVAEAFTNQFAAYENSPRVFPNYMYLDMVSRAMQHPRKFILAVTNVQSSLDINLEQQLRKGLLDIGVEVPPK